MNRDRLAVIIIAALLILGSLTPYLKAFSYFPLVGERFAKLSTILPRLGQEHFNMPEIDCIGYYVFLRSLMVDGDLSLHNDFKIYGWYQRASVWSVGPAILWLPGFLIAHFLSYLLNAFGIMVPINGVSFLYDFFIANTSMLIGAAGIFIIYFFLRKLYSVKTSLLATLFMFYATPYVFYQFNQPTMSHILSATGMAAFIYFWYNTFGKREQKEWIFLGLIAGATVLIRPQNIFSIAIALLVELFYEYKKEGTANFIRRFRPIATVGSLIVLFFVPQMIAWKLQYGQWLTVPQGKGVFVWSQAYKYIHLVLFSTNHGLITYTPIVLFAIIGLFLFYKDVKNRHLFYTFFLMLITQIYINSGVVIDWACGSGFGSRRHMSLSIVFALGIATILDKVSFKKVLFYGTISLFSFLVIFNLLMYFQWYFGMIPGEGVLTFEQYFTDKVTALFSFLYLIMNFFRILIFNS
ncbi:glycosyltransferase family 39 protein [Candidatus Margulisiibacteriota bacterium]